MYLTLAMIGCPRSVENQPYYSKYKCELNLQVADLQPLKSSRFGGKKLFSSMKKSLGSLRLPRKPIRADEINSRRRQSDSIYTSGSEENSYPGTCT